MKFVDDFYAYCRDFTGSPEPFIRWTALLVLSAIAGTKHVLRRGDWDVKPNLWILLMGNSSSYKSIALNSGRRLLFEACSGILASQEYSHEALIEDVAANPHRVFFYDEAEYYFKMMAQTYNAPMRSAMMSLYAGVPIQRQIKGKTGKGEVHTITNAYICWGGASTPFQIAASLQGSTTDFLSGLFPRFLLVPYFGTESHVEDPPPYDQAKRSALIARLKDLSLMGEREYSYSTAALQAKHKWLIEFNKRAESCEVLLSAFYRKLRDEHFHKIAMLAAFERESSIIEVEDVAETSSLLWSVERGWPTLLERMTEKEWDREANRIESYIKKNGIVDRTNILNDISGIKAQKLTAILYGLEQDGKITQQFEETGGRRRNVIVWQT
jgi:hypothetical protein